MVDINGASVILAHGCIQKNAPKHMLWLSASMTVIGRKGKSGSPWFNPLEALNIPQICSPLTMIEKLDEETQHLIQSLHFKQKHLLSTIYQGSLNQPYPKLSTSNIMATPQLLFLCTPRWFINNKRRIKNLPTLHKGRLIIHDGRSSFL